VSYTEITGTDMRSDTFIPLTFSVMDASILSQGRMWTLAPYREVGNIAVRMSVMDMTPARYPEGCTTGRVLTVPDFSCERASCIREMNLPMPSVGKRHEVMAVMASPALMMVLSQQSFASPCSG